MAQYLHVWVRSDRYRGQEALTYKSDASLAIGSIVQIPLRSEQVFGFVAGGTTRPAFKTKSITATPPLPPLPIETVRLAEWLTKFYASPVGVATSLFLPKGLAVRLNATDSSTPAKTLARQPRLTTEQQAALQRIDNPDTYTLHGRTGSGKTRLYIELARKAVNDGKSAIVLCPEIGLTSQIAEQFTNVFGNVVITLHSQLTAKEREIKWQRILTAQSPVIVIGPRSALFSPVHNLGLIVIDESHDQAYKQEQPPYYHAVRVASHLRELYQAILVLGSATPAVTDYYVAQVREKPIIRLSQLAKDTPADREITIVDLKDRSQFTHSGLISDTLRQSISASLNNGEQALLYLNRRGTARVTLCDACGWQARCPHCDLPLTYHGDTYHLRCHICGYRQSPPTSCPICGNPSIAFKSLGTKAIVTEAQRLFPDARILRFDSDNTKTERLEEQYENVIGGNVDILVGTQLLAKGLDLPRLSTLGIILADTSLYLPDYTAQERTYQLLTQVIGRVGRGHLASRAIVQTYYPESELLRAALADDWNAFYEAEIAERRRYTFPPFCSLLKLSARRATSESAERTLKAFKATLEASKLPVVIDGPAPALHEKIGTKYQWQLVLKARSRASLIEALKMMPKDWTYDIDPVDLL